MTQRAGARLRRLSVRHAGTFMWIDGTEVPVLLNSSLPAVALDDWLLPYQVEQRNDVLGDGAGKQWNTQRLRFGGETPMRCRIEAEPPDTLQALGIARRARERDGERRVAARPRYQRPARRGPPGSTPG